MKPYLNASLLEIRPVVYEVQAVLLLAYHPTQGVTEFVNLGDMASGALDARYATLELIEGT